MRIAVDAMGGDNAPLAIVNGALVAAPHVDGEIILVGDTDAIKKCLPSSVPRNIHIVHTTETIEMDESPVDALRKKRDSSLMVAAMMVKNGEADGMLSAGNTGAAAAAAHLNWKCLPGISKPAIATTFPSKKGKFILIDSGAIPDSDARNLLEYAFMGSLYAQTVLKIRNPRVGLLNIGEEETKGNKLTKQAYKLLKESLPNFAGNVEGKDLFKGDFEVVVCDAFVGNVVLKSAQGIVEFMWEIFKDTFPKNLITKSIVFWLSKKGLMEAKRRVDYSEIGGAPLLGVNGLCMICHGRSNAKAIKNAILMSQQEYKHNLNQLIIEKASEYETPREGANVS